MGSTTGGGTELGVRWQSPKRACERRTSTPLLHRAGTDLAHKEKAVSTARTPAGRRASSPLPPHSKLGSEKDVRVNEGNAMGPKEERY